MKISFRPNKGDPLMFLRYEDDEWEKFAEMYEERRTHRKGYGQWTRTRT